MNKVLLGMATTGQEQGSDVLYLVSSDFHCLRKRVENYYSCPAGSSPLSDTDLRETMSARPIGVGNYVFTFTFRMLGAFTESILRMGYRLRF